MTGRMKSLFRVLYGCLFLSLVAGIWVHFYLHPEVHFFWEAFPAFSALYGFIGCVVIIMGSKAIGHYWLQKREDYYEKPKGKQREGK
ncbi:MAG: hypothetical protein Q8P64_04640 [Deltaproteobacteria bacterium]|jgi:hypothetical protein|nr:hypothetical protein [Deltaproteobacteria bacterium]